jgi:glycosyltransferase involved in cell wall biosynthesis
VIRLALNTRTLTGPRTGIGHYTFELAKGLAALPEVSLCCFNGSSWSMGLPAVDTVNAPDVRHASRSKAANIPGAYALRRALEQRRFDRGLRNNAIGLYHEPSLWPLEFDGPTVMTVHDLCHIKFPETQPRARLSHMQRIFPKALEHCTKIITDTEQVRQDLLALFDLSPAKVKTVPLGVSPRFHPRTPAPGELPANLQAGAYFLCVGTLEPRKNLPLVLQAHSRLSVSDQQRYPLVIVGGRGWKDAQVLKLCDRKGVVRLGYVDDEPLATLVAGARALLFPSLYEGFGLPVLEAMASGTSIVLSGESSPMEVAGGAAIVASADKSEPWTECMQALIAQPEDFATRRQAGLARASELSWRRCVAETLNVYRSALE